MTLSRRVIAHGQIYNIPKKIDCTRCHNFTAAPGCDVELYENIINGFTTYEEDYKCVYTCTGCGYEQNVIVVLRE